MSTDTSRSAGAAAPGLSKAATRTVNRAGIVDRNFIEAVARLAPAEERAHPDAPLTPGSTLSGRVALQVFSAQMQSRHLDLAAREMRARNEGFYTIGSSGHENNAVVGHLSRHTDPAFLHYRSGGFMMARSAKVDGIDPVHDCALSLAASSEDPASGGRHKVWGSAPLWVLPQTSTIASHLPKAVGAALALEQCRRLDRPAPVPDDSIIICSFGDASANHAASQAAFNAASWAAYQHLPVPLLFVCEDNQIGISVQTPHNWIAASIANRPGLHYVRADGTDMAATWAATEEALDHCRMRRQPVFLHLDVVRLMGHAGTDFEAEYRPIGSIEAAEARDPLLRSARLLVEAGIASSEELLERYEDVRQRVRLAAEQAARRPKLDKLDAVMEPLAPYRPKVVHAEATRDNYREQRVAAFGDQGLPENAPPRHMALQINRALRDLMAKYPQMTLFGEDVAQKGGVYTVTTGLAGHFGPNRVFNTLLDETTILGLAQGAGSMGLLPFPEIQYLAYFHNAADQIRGEACSLQFFSNGQFRNPMVMRVAGLAYQKGFGGHFHNDNSFTALRDIPGLVIACPSRGDDAVAMLRGCAALAHVDGRVVAFLEPIALYMSKDLHAPKDGLWQFPYPAPGHCVLSGEGRVYDEAADDLLIVSYGNGVPMSLRVAKKVQEETGKRIRILDLRWLKPLNAEWIAEHARAVGRVLVVDEGRRSGGIAEEVMTALVEHCEQPPLTRRVCGADSYIPLGDAANTVLVAEEDIRAAAMALLA